MFCNLEEKHKTEIHPKYSKDNLLIPAYCSFRSTMYFSGGVAYSWKSSPKRPSKKLLKAQYFTDILQDLYILLQR